MADLYAKLDNVVEKVIGLSQAYGNLAKYGDNPGDKEWLRNELEQICEIGKPSNTPTKEPVYITIDTSDIKNLETVLSKVFMQVVTVPGRQFNIHVM